MYPANSADIAIINSCNANRVWLLGKYSTCHAVHKRQAQQELASFHQFITPQFPTLRFFCRFDQLLLVLLARGQVLLGKRPIFRANSHESPFVESGTVRGQRTQVWRRLTRSRRVQRRITRPQQFDDAPPKLTRRRSRAAPHDGRKK